MSEQEGKPYKLVDNNGVQERHYESGVILNHDTGRIIQGDKSKEITPSSATDLHKRRKELKQQGIENAIMSAGGGDLGLGMEELAQALVRIIKKNEGHAAVKAFDTLMKHYGAVERDKTPGITIKPLIDTGVAAQIIALLSGNVSDNYTYRKHNVSQSEAIDTEYTEE